MSSFLDKKDGVYDKSKRFIFYNWSDEDFTQHFGAESGYNGTTVIETNPAYDVVVKAGESRECGEFEALTMTRYFVNREMDKEVRKIKNTIERNNRGMMIDNAEIRKPYEDKTLSEIKAGEESPLVAKLKADAIAEYIKNQQMKNSDVGIVQQPIKVEPEVVKQIENEAKVDKRTKAYKESVKEFSDLKK